MQWRRGQVESGDWGINIEKSEGVGYGEGHVPSPVGGLGACPRKKSILH